MKSGPSRFSCLGQRDRIRDAQKRLIGESQEVAERVSRMRSELKIGRTFVLHRLPCSYGTAVPAIANLEERYCPEAPLLSANQHKK